MNFTRTLQSENGRAMVPRDFVYPSSADGVRVQRTLLVGTRCWRNERRCACPTAPDEDALPSQLRRSVLLTAILALNLLLSSAVLGQSYFTFRNVDPPSVNAPVLDAQGVPLAGPLYSGELFGGATQDSLAPLVLLREGLPRLIKPFLTDGYVRPADGDRLVVPTVPPGGWAWLQMRAWDSSLGATYEEVAALGIGGYGESSLFYAQGSDPFDILGLPAPLAGLQSFSLRPIVPEPSTWALLAWGAMALSLTRRART